MSLIYALFYLSFAVLFVPYSSSSKVADKSGSKSASSPKEPKLTTRVETDIEKTLNFFEHISTRSKPGLTQEAFETIVKELFDSKVRDAFPDHFVKHLDKLVEFCKQLFNPFHPLDKKHFIVREFPKKVRNLLIELRDLRVEVCEEDAVYKNFRTSDAKRSYMFGRFMTDISNPNLVDSVFIRECIRSLEESKLQEEIRSEKIFQELKEQLEDIMDSITQQKDMWIPRAKIVDVEVIGEGPLNPKKIPTQFTPKKNDIKQYDSKGVSRPYSKDSDSKNTNTQKTLTSSSPSNTSDSSSKFNAANVKPSSQRSQTKIPLISNTRDTSNNSPLSFTTNSFTGGSRITEITEEAEELENNSKDDENNSVEEKAKKEAMYEKKSTFWQRNRIWIIIVSGIIVIGVAGTIAFVIIRKNRQRSSLKPSLSLLRL